MPGDYRLFSCALTALDSEQVAWCRHRLEELEREGALSTSDRGADFEWQIEDDPEEPVFKQLWMYSDDHGSTNHTASFVQEFLRRFRPTDWWWMSWADTATRRQVGEFSGGAVFVTAETINFVEAHDWARQQVDAFCRSKGPG
jgi:hypothetical protein